MVRLIRLPRMQEGFFIAGGICSFRARPPRRAGGGGAVLARCARLT